jgi:hypothetical protein
MPKQNGETTFSFADEPPPPKTAIKKNPKDLAEALLGWLERWPKNIVSSRDIRIWGPKILHSREGAIRSAEILVAHGFLSPITDRKWQVIRKPLIPQTPRR